MRYVGGYPVVRAPGYNNAGHSAGPGFEAGDIDTAPPGRVPVALPRGYDWRITVVRDEGNTSYGKWVEARAVGVALTVRYAHLSKQHSIKVGERAEGGCLIGWTGNTGGSTSEHLHFEVSGAPWWRIAERIWEVTTVLTTDDKQFIRAEIEKESRQQMKQLLDLWTVGKAPAWLKDATRRSRADRFNLKRVLSKG